MGVLVAAAAAVLAQQATECSSLTNYGTCRSAQPAQECVDETPMLDGDWYCRCWASLRGAKRGGAAECVEVGDIPDLGVDECTTRVRRVDPDAVQDDTRIAGTVLMTFPFGSEDECRLQCDGRDACDGFQYALYPLDSHVAGTNCIDSRACCWLFTQRNITDFTFLPTPRGAFRSGTKAVVSPAAVGVTGQNMCEDGGQTCVDPTAGNTILRDWVCRCREPQFGGAVGAPAACDLPAKTPLTYDECAGECPGTMRRRISTVLRAQDPADQLLERPVQSYAECEMECSNRRDCAGLTYMAVFSNTPNTPAWPTAACKEGLPCCFLLRAVNSYPLGNADFDCAEKMPIPNCAYDPRTRQSVCENYGQDCIDPTAGGQTTSDWQCACRTGPRNPSTASPSTCQTDPPTPMPPTPAPPTNSPPTSAPPTLAPPTSAPPTNLPPTPAPPTNAPTAAPPTAVPPTPTPPTPTNAPQTPAPQTPEPATPAPPTPLPMPSPAPSPSPGSGVAPVTPAPLRLTPVPTTQVPALAATTVPATAAPPPAPALPKATRAPRTGVPETPAPTAVAKRVAELVGTQKRSVAVDATVMSAVTVGAGPALRLATIAANCDPDAQDPAARYTHVMSPLQLQVGGSHAVGAIVGNVVLVAAAYALGGAATFLASRCRQRHNSDAWGTARFPAAQLIVVQLLYPGTVMAAVELLLVAPSRLLAAVGVVVTLATTSIPIALFYLVGNSVPHRAFVCVDPDTRDDPVAVFLLGAGEWVSRTRNPHWAQRWTSAVRPYRGETAWFIAIDFAAMFGVAACHGVVPSTLEGCGHIKLASGALMMLLFLVEAAATPHIHARNNYIDSGTLLVKAAAMVALALGYYQGADADGSVRGITEFRAAGYILAVVTGLLLLRFLLDLLMLAYVSCAGRRGRLQAWVWACADPVVITTPSFNKNTSSPQAPSLSPTPSDALQHPLQSPSFDAVGTQPATPLALTMLDEGDPLKPSFSVNRSQVMAAAAAASPSAPQSEGTPAFSSSQLLDMPPRRVESRKFLRSTTILAETHRPWGIGNGTVSSVSTPTTQTPVAPYPRRGSALGHTFPCLPQQTSSSVREVRGASGAAGGLCPLEPRVSGNLNATTTTPTDRVAVPVAVLSMTVGRTASRSAANSMPSSDCGGGSTPASPSRDGPMLPPVRRERSAPRGLSAPPKVLHAMTAL